MLALCKLVDVSVCAGRADAQKPKLLDISLETLAKYIWEKNYHGLPMINSDCHWFYWLSLNIVEYYWVSLIIIDYHCLSLIIIDYRWHFWSSSPQFLVFQIFLRRPPPRRVSQGDDSVLTFLNCLSWNLTTSERTGITFSAEWRWKLKTKVSFNIKNSGFPLALCKWFWWRMVMIFW